MHALYIGMQHTQQAGITTTTRETHSAPNVAPDAQGERVALLGRQVSGGGRRAAVGLLARLPRVEQRALHPLVLRLRTCMSHD